MLLQLIQMAGGLAGSWIQGKMDEGKAKQQLKLKAMENTEAWEAWQARSAANSWKDEWFAIILSIPMIGAFIPDLVPYIQQGFAVLSGMPDYYKGFLAAAIAASFGIKSVANWKK